MLDDHQFAGKSDYLYTITLVILPVIIFIWFLILQSIAGREWLELSVVAVGRKYDTSYITRPHKKYPFFHYINRIMIDLFVGSYVIYLRIKHGKVMMYLPFLYGNYDKQGPLDFMYLLTLSSISAIGCSSKLICVILCYNVSYILRSIE